MHTETHHNNECQGEEDAAPKLRNLHGVGKGCYHIRMTGKTIVFGEDPLLIRRGATHVRTSVAPDGNRRVLWLLHQLAGLAE